MEHGSWEDIQVLSHGESRTQDVAQSGSLASR